MASSASIRFYDSPDGLMFELHKKSTACAHALAELINIPATERHKKEYAGQYQIYLDTREASDGND